jgi:integrase
MSGTYGTHDYGEGPANMTTGTKSSGVLLVIERDKGPMVYAKFRDSSGSQRKPSLGLGWLVPEGDSRAARPRRRSGRAVPIPRIGDWVERTGQPEDGALTVAMAEEAMIAAKTEAEAKLARFAAVAEEERNRVVTLKEAAEAWMAWRSVEDPEGAHDGWKTTTRVNVATYVGRLLRELGPDRPVASVDTEELRTLLNDGLLPLRNGKPIEGRETSRKMRNLYAIYLRGIFAYALTREWIETDPTSALSTYRARRKRSDDPLRRDEYLTPEEVRSVVTELVSGDPDAPRGKRLADRVRVKRKNEQDGAMALVMAMCGLRPGEALALRWENVNIAGPSLNIVEALAMGVTDTPKSGAGRTVPMPAEVAEALASIKLRGHHTGPRDLVFVNGVDGEHVGLFVFRERFYSAQDRASISPRRNVKQLRNTFGTVCAAGNVPLRTLQQWMGHASITTTEIYASFMPRDGDAALVSAAFASSSAA